MLRNNLTLPWAWQPFFVEPVMLGPQISSGYTIIIQSYKKTKKSKTNFHCHVIPIIWYNQISLLNKITLTSIKLWYELLTRQFENTCKIKKKNKNKNKQML
jgi:hypothetical protein